MTQTSQPQDPQGPMDALREAMTRYFAGGSVGMADPLMTKMMEGFVIDITTKLWSGWVRLEPEDWGLTSDTYSSLDLRWGGINLLEPELRKHLHTIRTTILKLPAKWGRVVRGQRYIPLTAMGRFRKEFDRLAEQWRIAIDDWLARYAEAYAYAEAQVDALAARAVENAQRLQDAGVLPDHDAMVARIMQAYPSYEKIRDEFVVEYTINVIPTPQLVARQTAELALIEEEKQQRLQQQRQEAERRTYEHEEARLKALNAIDVEQRKLAEHQAIIKEERARLQAELEQKRLALLDEFYTGYALDIRQRLHESLMFVIEGVRNGKVSPSAGKSLRTVLDEVKSLVLDDDQEIQQMEQRLSTLMEEVESRKSKVTDIKDTIEDFGMLLQTSILALGEQPRMPKRNGQAVVGQDSIMELPMDAVLGDTVRQARQRSGLDTSLAEILVEAGGLSLDTLRRRRHLDTAGESIDE